MEGPAAAAAGAAWAPVSGELPFVATSGAGRTVDEPGFAQRLHDEVRNAKEDHRSQCHLPGDQDHEQTEHHEQAGRDDERQDAVEDGGGALRMVVNDGVQFSAVRSGM